MNILCKHSIQTDYCWFRDPSGQKISLSDKKPPSEDDMYRFGLGPRINTINKCSLIRNTSFRYYGTGIELGECGLTILNAAHNHSGTWSCHMGTTHVAGTDTVQEISVRITGKSFSTSHCLIFNKAIEVCVFLFASANSTLYF